MKTAAALIALVGLATAAAAQDQTKHYTAVGSAPVREQACLTARGNISSYIAADSRQRNTHHYNYAYASRVSECTCSEKAGEEKVEPCVSSIAPNCVDSRRVVRSPSTWSCNATGVLTITVTPTK